MRTLDPKSPSAFFSPGACGLVGGGDDLEAEDTPSAPGGWPPGLIPCPRLPWKTKKRRALPSSLSSPQG